MGAPPRSHRMQMGTTGNVKSDFKAYVRLVVVLILFALLVVVFFSVTNTQKEEATSSDVRLAMTEQGYTPYNLTDIYHQQDNGYKLYLINCVGIQKDDLRLHFFEFNDSVAAENICKQARSDAIIKYDASRGVEILEYSGNFSIYTLDSKGVYSVSIHVGNTAVIGNCNSENKGEINAILSKIDYLER